MAPGKKTGPEFGKPLAHSLEKEQIGAERTYRGQKQFTRKRDERSGGLIFTQSIRGATESKSSQQFSQLSNFHFLQVTLQLSSYLGQNVPVAAGIQLTFILSCHSYFIFAANIYSILSTKCQPSQAQKKLPTVFR